MTTLFQTALRPRSDKRSRFKVRKPNWRNLLKRFRRDEAGSYLIITGLMMPALIGFAGLGTEAGLLYQKHRTMQSAADSAAVSAATALFVESNNPSLASVLLAQANAVTSPFGFPNGSNGATVTVNQPPTSGPHIASVGAVEVVISQTQKRLFSAIWSSEPVTVTARSVAVAAGGTGCVLALDPLARSAANFSGNPKVNLNSCGLYDNSADSAALNVGGSAQLSALSVNVVGDISGYGNITAANGIRTGVAPLIDPYAGTTIPPFSGCTSHNLTIKAAKTIDPGVYCGGIAFNAGANAKLNPGIYYIDGGDVTVNGGAIVAGSGVSLVFTSSSGNYSTATISGGATVNLTAPTSGDMAGFVIYGDRGMQVGTTFKLNGGASQVLNGAIYLPKAAVDFAGGNDSDTKCLQLIGNTLKFVGNSSLAINCDGYGTKKLGSANAKLVE
jgi:Flp pilus assembly protein TadG